MAVSGTNRANDAASRETTAGRTSGKRPGRVRRIAFVVVLVLFALMHLLLSPMPFAILGWFLEETAVSHRVHETAFGLVFVLSFVALLTQLRRPDRKPAAMYMVAIPIWLLALAVLVVDRDADPVVFAFIIFPALLIALHPARSQILRPQTRMSQPMMGLVLVAAVPLIVFAVGQTSTGLDASDIGRSVWQQVEDDCDDPDVSVTACERMFERALRDSTDSVVQRESARHYGHWSAMGGFALAVVGLGMVGSLRIGGWRLLAWGAGLALAFYGVASLVAPNDASAANSLWAILATGWGIAFILVTERVARPSLAVGVTEESPSS